LIGLSVNTLFDIFGIESVNSMYLESPPFPNVPFINFYTIGLLGLLISFIGLNLYELFKYKKEDRWIYKIRKKVEDYNV
jgi:hypothetical protein